jgi:hypothetical protein
MVLIAINYLLFLVILRGGFSGFHFTGEVGFLTIQCVAKFKLGWAFVTYLGTPFLWWGGGGYSCAY